MGIRDFLEDVVYCTVDITRAFGELGIGLTKTLVEGASEFGEIMTDGVKEIIIEGNDDYKTSFEKKDLASEINYSASSRLEASEEIFNKKVEKTNLLIMNNLEHKKRLLIMVGEKIDSNYLDNGLIKHIYTNQIASINFDDKLKFSLAAKVGSLGKKIRKDIANDYLNNAINFSAEVDVEISKINTLIAVLEGIEKQISEEQEILLIFEEALKKNKNIALEESYRLLEEMIKNEILDEFGNVSNKYLNEFNRLKHICSQFV